MNLVLKALRRRIVDINIMDDNKRRWLYSRDNLMTAVRSLGYPDKLGEEIVKNLGSPKAMEQRSITK